MTFDVVPSSTHNGYLVSLPFNPGEAGALAKVDAVRCTLSASRCLVSGDTYELREGTFHRTAVEGDSLVAVLMETTSVDVAAHPLSVLGTSEARAPVVTAIDLSPEVRWDFIYAAVQAFGESYGEKK